MSGTLFSQQIGPSMRLVSAFLLASALALGAPEPGFAQQAAPQTGQAQRAPELAKIEAYLESITTLKGRFVQVAPDGRVSEGEIYLRRPGRLRFKYDQPVPLLIVADGTWLGMWDSELKQVDRVPLSSTPLGVLVDAKADFSGRFTVRRVSRATGLLSVVVYDKEKPEEGDITLIFGDEPIELKQWIVRDSRRLETKVSLYDVTTNIPLDIKLFVLTDSGPSVP